MINPSPSSSVQIMLVSKILDGVSRKQNTDGDRIQDSWPFHAHLWTNLFGIYATQKKNKQTTT